MPTILLMDDRERRRDQVTESSLATLGARLEEIEGYECAYEAGKDQRQFPIDDVPKMAAKVFARVTQEDIDGLVIDLNWWGDNEFGIRLWKEVKSLGLAMDKRCVVFITQHVSAAGRSSIVADNELDPRQVCYRDKNGFDTIIKWLVTNV